MVYREYITRMVEIYNGYAVKFPKSTYVRDMLTSYTAMLNSGTLDKVVMDDEEMEKFFEVHRNFEVILEANPELTTEQEQNNAWAL